MTDDDGGEIIVQLAIDALNLHTKPDVDCITLSHGCPDVLIPFMQHVGRPLHRDSMALVELAFRVQVFLQLLAEAHLNVPI